MSKNYLTVTVLSLFLMTSCKLQQDQATIKLHRAVLAGKVEGVKKYLKKGASVNYQEDKMGWTPLLFAIEGNQEEIVKVLIDHGASVNMTSTKNKISPLQRAASKGNMQIVKLLISQGADINHQDTQFRSTPLMWAAANGHQEIARYLLDRGAFIDVRGNRGESALFLAVSAAQVEMVKLLLAYDANADRPDIYGITPVQKATKLENQEIINLINNQ